MSLADYDFREPSSRLVQLPPPSRRSPPGAWLGPLLAFSLVFWGGVLYAVYRGWGFAP